MTTRHRVEPPADEEGTQAVSDTELLPQVIGVHDLLTGVLSGAASAIDTALAAPPKLGVDVVDIDVLARQLSSRVGDAFKRRIFTENEIADSRDQAPKFATRWAVKEAVSKAIGTGFRQGLNPIAIEVRTSSDGSIRVAPSPGYVWPGSASDWRWSVSAAHEGNMAVAVAIALA